MMVLMLLAGLFAAPPVTFMIPALVRDNWARARAR